MNNGSNEYPLNTGALFKNQNRSTAKAPILTGVIELDRELVTHLYRLLESGKKAKLNLGGWRNTSRNGLTYFTIQASPEYKAPSKKQQADEDTYDVFDL